jgi:hypothetical protein
MHCVFSSIVAALAALLLLLVSSPATAQYTCKGRGLTFSNENLGAAFFSNCDNQTIVLRSISAETVQFMSPLRNVSLLIEDLICVSGLARCVTFDGDVVSSSVVIRGIRRSVSGDFGDDAAVTAVRFQRALVRSSATISSIEMFVSVRASVTVVSMTGASSGVSQLTVEHVTLTGRVTGGTVFLVFVGSVARQHGECRSSDADALCCGRYHSRLLHLHLKLHHQQCRFHGETDEDGAAPSS